MAARVGERLWSGAIGPVPQHAAQADAAILGSTWSHGVTQGRVISPSTSTVVMSLSLSLSLVVRVPCSICRYFVDNLVKG